VPGWLALLVLVLLLGVSALGGYLIRGAIVDKQERATPADYAVQSLEDEVAEDPDNPENQLALGYAYQQEGRYTEALERYDAVLAEDARNTGALYNKAVVLMTVGKTKESEAAFWDLLDVAPDHVLGAKALGEYYIGKKHYKSALVALEPVIKLQPSYSDLQYLAGYSCEMLNLRDAAIGYYRGAVTYNPDHIQAKDALTRLGEPL
jgi:tetratricopeptide (TPR) repeat protein